MKTTCAYCGQQDKKYSREHVISKALYPESKASSKIQRITVPVCECCRGNWDDDEPHFRNVMLISGQENPAVMELWKGKVNRSFKLEDGLRRYRQLYLHTEKIQRPEGERYMIYPDQDVRVLRVVHKIIRGLSHYHGIATIASDQSIWVAIQLFNFPPALDDLALGVTDEDVIKYRYKALNEDGIQSYWTLTFYERTSFLGVAFQSPDECSRFLKMEDKKC
ncbi:MAG: hypothetical protein AB7F75_09935 [Planctomycetota bacterium]